MAVHETVRVELGARSYDILIGEDVLAKAGKWLLPVLAQKRAIIISDANVAPLYLEHVTVPLAGSQVQLQHVTVPAGEGSKSFSQYASLMESILAFKPERKTTLIALGGGVVGDLVGFAASTLLRGVPFIQVPTTLLSQVDSSVGGKTGINTTHGKNLVGSFYQPKRVLIDTHTLSTLPDRQMRAGYAEVVKYGLIQDADFFNWLEQNGQQVIDGNAQALAHAVKVSCEQKAAIVKKDEHEIGVRALLNLGHTFGHALEAETGYGDALLHGEAVSIGMVLAFQLSTQLRLCPKSDTERVITHLQAMGLPTRLADVPGIRWQVERLIHHFGQDKKVADGRLTFILARGIGKSFITQDVERTALVNCLEAACRM